MSEICVESEKQIASFALMLAQSYHIFRKAISVQYKKKYNSVFRLKENEQENIVLPTRQANKQQQYMINSFCCILTLLVHNCFMI